MDSHSELTFQASQNGRPRPYSAIPDHYTIGAAAEVKGGVGNLFL